MKDGCPDEAQLLIRLKKGDSKVMDELYRYYGRHLLEGALRKGFPADKAVGLVQGIFFNLWVKRETLHPTMVLNDYLNWKLDNSLFDHNHRVDERIQDRPAPPLKIDLDRLYETAGLRLHDLINKGRTKMVFRRNGIGEYPEFVLLAARY